MNAIDHTAFGLPSMPSAATLDLIQTAGEIHALYFSLLTVATVIVGVPAADRHLQAYADIVDRDIEILAARARDKLSTIAGERDRSLLRRVVLDFEMRCDLPGEEFQALTDQAIARAAA